MARLSVHPMPDLLDNDRRVIGRGTLREIEFDTPASKVRLDPLGCGVAVEARDGIRTPTHVGQDGKNVAARSSCPRLNRSGRIGADDEVESDQARAKDGRRSAQRT